MTLSESTRLAPDGGSHFSRSALLRLGLWLFMALVIGATLTAMLGDVGRVAGLVRSISPFWFVAMILAVCFNYGLRFLKWNYFLKRLGIKITFGDSLWIFFSAFTMVLSPGKLGELMKSVLLKSRYSIPVARSAPIVLAERVTDLLGLVALSLIGSSRFAVGTGGLIVLGILLGVGVVSITRRGFWSFLDRSVLSRFKRLASLRRSFQVLEESSQNLLSLPSLLLTVPLSILSWAGEGVALFFIFRALGVDLPELLGVSVFSHAVSSILGALSFLPGGMGVTEGTLGGLFLYVGIGREPAIAATLLIRGVTLWFAVVLGTVVFLVWRRPGETLSSQPAK